MGLLDIFSNSDQQKRKSHLENLLRVGLADGNLDQTELEYLISLARKLNMPGKELDEILQDKIEIKFKPPSSFEDKVDQLHDLVYMMLINGEIHEKELKICKTLALKLDILPKMVDDIVKLVIDKTTDGKSPKTIVEELSELKPAE